MLTVLAVGAVLLAACGSGKDSKSSGNTNTQAATETNAVPTGEPVVGEYRTLSIDEFADIVENHANDYEIINVHIPMQAKWRTPTPVSLTTIWGC